MSRFSPSCDYISSVAFLQKKSRCLPPDLAVATNAWKKALPYHHFFFHDDDAVDRLFQLEWTEFPQLEKYMKCVSKGAMKIDVWRILILYLYGGIYTDVDNIPLQAFTEIAPISADDEFFSLSDAWDRPSQWFFAMEAKHPIGYYIMSEIFKRLHDLENIQRPKIVFVTGPDAFKHGYGNFLGWPDGLYDDGIHRSKKFNKTVTKISNQKNIYVTTMDFDKIVHGDKNESITVREKIERQSGVIHWTHYKNAIKFGGSCLDFIYKSELLNEEKQNATQ